MTRLAARRDRRSCDPAARGPKSASPPPSLIYARCRRWFASGGALVRHADLLEPLENAAGATGRSLALDWQPMVEPLQPARSLFVLGRGLGLGVAQEAALKFKETCGLHAEAFSGAEVRHGPMALMQKNLPA